MNAKKREFAEKALKHLLIGSQLDGVKFGLSPGSFLIRFERYYPPEQEPEQLWINIESKWTVFPTEIIDYPNSEDEMDDLNEEEQLNLVFKLRRDKVVDVKLGETIPHLIMVFQSGLTMFVNGHDDMYECWQVGDGAGYGSKIWEIVATPGDGIATWAPDDFQ